jgi:hypothetical protein
MSLAEARRRRTVAGAILGELQDVLAAPPPLSEEDARRWRPRVAAMERVLLTASAWVSGAAQEVCGLRGIVEALRPKRRMFWT